MSAAAIMCLMDSVKYKKPNSEPIRGGMVIFGMNTPRTLIEKSTEIVFKWVDYNDGLFYVGKQLRIIDGQEYVYTIQLSIYDYEYTKGNYVVIGDEMGRY